MNGNFVDCDFDKTWNLKVGSWFWWWCMWIYMGAANEEELLVFLVAVIELDPVSCFLCHVLLSVPSQRPTPWCYKVLRYHSRINSFLVQCTFIVNFLTVSQLAVRNFTSLPPLQQLGHCVASCIVSDWNIVCPGFGCWSEYVVHSSCRTTGTEAEFAPQRLTWVCTLIQIFPRWRSSSLLFKVVYMWHQNLGLWCFIHATFV